MLTSLLPLWAAVPVRSLSLDWPCKKILGLIELEFPLKEGLCFRKHKGGSLLLSQHCSARRNYINAVHATVNSAEVLLGDLEG